MSLFQPTRLLQFLESIGHKQPNKRLSQNFLIDGNILKKIVSHARVSQGDLFVEIGTGPGALTEALLQQGAHVLAIEKDPLFAQALTRLSSASAQLTVFEEDILKFPLEDFLKSHLSNNKKAKVVSNLPYHLTSPIFDKLLPLYDLIETVIVMVQKEVADRIVAKKGSKNYCSFSVFTQFYSHPKLLFQVSPHCFYPRPKVTSAVVECILQSSYQSVDPRLFFDFIKTLFTKRRKMICTSLRESWNISQIQQALDQLRVNTKARPEELSLEELLKLFLLLNAL